MKHRGQVDAEKNSGSLKKGEPEFLAVGKLRSPFGLSGEMKFEAYIEDLGIFSPGGEVFTGKKHFRRKIASFRESGKNLLIHFTGVVNPEGARLLTNQILYIPSEDLPELEDDSYYHRQLIGLKVEDVAGNLIGRISEIIETGANDVYVVFSEDDDKEILLPAIKSVVLKIDIESNLMVVKQPEWFD